MTTPLYPEPSAPLGEVFGGAPIADPRTLDAHRTPIRDRYGLTEYPGLREPLSPVVFTSDGAMLHTLGVPARDLLGLADPTEHARVEALWRDRRAALQRVTGADTIVVRFVHEGERATPPAECAPAHLASDRAICARLGTTLERAGMLAGVAW